MPPVSAQNRKKLAVQLFTADADDNYLSPQRVVSALAAVPVIPFPREVRRYAPQAPGYVLCAIGNLNADFGIPD